MVAVGRQQLADRRGGLAMLVVGHLGHQPAEAFQHVDGRIVAARAELPRQPGVAVEQAAHGVADRLVGVVGLDQHGVEGGDAALRAAAGALDQLRQQGEDRGRIAARGGRLAGRQADLALGQREPRQRVHQQQHVLALVAEVLGDGRGRGGRLDAHQGRLVAGGHHDHALGQPFGPQVALDELVDLAAALADQGDDDHVGGRVAGHHAQQHALAHAGAGEDAHPLPLAAGQQAVDRADAGGQRLVDPRPRAGMRRRAVEARCGRQAPAAACRRRRCPAASITRPSSSVPTRSQRVVRASRTRLPRRTPARSLKRIEHRQVVAEADHLGQQRRARFAAGSRPPRRPAPGSRPPRRHADRPAPRCPSGRSA